MTEYETIRLTKTPESIALSACRRLVMADAMHDEEAYKAALSLLAEAFGDMQRKRDALDEDFPPIIPDMGVGLQDAFDKVFNN